MMEVESVKDRVIERERRKYTRHTSIPALVEVAGAFWTIVDFSLGGFCARTSEHLPKLGERVAGAVLSNEDGRRFRIDFDGRVARVDQKNRLVAVEFGSLPDASLDMLMHVLAVLEAEWAAHIALLDRQSRLAVLRKSLLRGALVIAVVAAATMVLMGVL